MSVVRRGESQEVAAVIVRSPHFDGSCHDFEIPRQAEYYGQNEE